MKKFFILLFLAALVGVIISRTKTTPKEEKPDALRLQTNAPEPEHTGEPAPPQTQRQPSGDAEGAPPAEGEKSSTPNPATKPPSDKQTGSPGTSTAKHGPSPPENAEKKPEQPSPQELLAETRRLLEKGKRVEARKRLTGLYLNSKGKLRDKVRHVLKGINSELVFNPRCLEGAQVHTGQQGESLTTIAEDYGVSWRRIARINGIDDPDVIREDQKLKIIAAEPSVLVNKSRFTLTLFLDGAYVKEYPIGLGADDKTPAGTFTIGNRLIRPDWSPRGGEIIKYGDPGYQLGERWLGFENLPGASGLGIHGTNDDQSIGIKQSNGCIRMLNKNVIELYDFVEKGTQVRIVE